MSSRDLLLKEYIAKCELGDKRLEKRGFNW